MTDRVSPGFDAAARAAILREVPTLVGLPDAELEALAAAMVVRRLAYKSVLARIGQSAAGRALRIVLLGSLLVQTPGADDSRRVVGPGMLFGEEGLVLWATQLGLLAPPPDGPFAAYVYAAEDCWVLELTADRFAAVFGAGARTSTLTRLGVAAWRTARAPELVAALRRTPELARASVDDCQALVEGGLLRAFTGDEVDGRASALVVLTGGVRRLGGDAQEEFRPGSVVGQASLLRDEPPELRGRFVAQDGTVVLEIPASHYERRLRADPDLLGAVLRMMPDSLALPRYRTEVSLILAAGGPQRQLPLAALTGALAQAIHSNLQDVTRVVRLAWDDAASGPADPLQIVLPRAAPLQTATRVRDALLEILAAEQPVDVLLIDPSALAPDPAIQRALVQAVTDLPAPARLSFLFAHPGEWSRVLEALGERVSRIGVLPTVLLAPEVPPAGLGAEAGAGGLARGLRALPAFARGQLERLTTVEPQALREAASFDMVRRLLQGGAAQAWPKTAVRLRLSEAGRAALAGGAGPARLTDEDDRESLRRWARALTGRRVGVALGGAGALSYVCVPMLRALRAEGVPIDIVSGTSFGSIVGAYYTTLGDRGLDLILRHWYWAQITVAWGWLSGWPLQQWINHDLGYVDISQLAVPFVPVATNAYNGREWDLRAGVVGHACSASGSLPPLAPTYDGNTRLLDGALSADVPDRVLLESGATMVIGANSIPPPREEPALPMLPVPMLGEMLRMLDPISRMTDFVRGYMMLFRQAGQSQDRHADVTYLADTKFGNGATFFLRNAIVYQAEQSPGLHEAVRLAGQRWRELLLRPRGRAPTRQIDGEIDARSRQATDRQ